jgi:hypothetical protein
MSGWLVGGYSRVQKYSMVEIQWGPKVADDCFAYLPGCSLLIFTLLDLQNGSFYSFGPAKLAFYSFGPAKLTFLLFFALKIEHFNPFSTSKLIIFIFQNAICRKGGPSRHMESLRISLSPSLSLKNPGGRRLAAARPDHYQPFHHVCCHLRRGFGLASSIG